MRRDARSALETLTASFPDAEVVEVASSAAGAAAAGDAVKRDQEAEPPKGGGNLSPQEYQTRSRELPNKVHSQGKPPPKDHTAPGGGGKATEIR